MRPIPTYEERSKLLPTSFWVSADSEESAYSVGTCFCATMTPRIRNFSGTHIRIRPEEDLERIGQAQAPPSQECGIDCATAFCDVTSNLAKRNSHSTCPIHPVSLSDFET